MIYTPLTKLATRLAYAAHAGQFDRSGLPYICHPLHVAESMPDELTTITALLHDVVEDSDWTLEGLRLEGFPEEVLEALMLLTHDKAVPYMDYVAAVAQNPVAKAVKLADLAHNSDLTRLNEITEKDRERLEKYEKAAAFLKETP